MKSSLLRSSKSIYCPDLVQTRLGKIKTLAHAEGNCFRVCLEAMSRASNSLDISSLQRKQLRSEAAVFLPCLLPQERAEPRYEIWGWH